MSFPARPWTTARVAGGGISRSPSALMVTAWVTIRRWRARSRQRRALRAIAEHNDYLLKDIGLTREQALREAERPFWRR